MTPAEMNLAIARAARLRTAHDAINDPILRREDGRYIHSDLACASGEVWGALQALTATMHEAFDAGYPASAAQHPVEPQAQEVAP